MKKQKNNKKGQEEIVGFAIIIVIVAVLILVFLSFSLRNNSRESVESFEVESYLQSVLQYTTECEDNLRHLTVQRLISTCENGASCESGEDPCDILNETLRGISNEAWQVGEDRPVKGYSLNVSVNGEDFVYLEEGNSTNNARSSKQDFPNAGNQIEIYFEAYF